MALEVFQVIICTLGVAYNVNRPNYWCWIWCWTSTTVVYIFHLTVNISFQKVIHTALSVSLLTDLLYWQNKSTVYLTQHFLKKNENLRFASFHYWHNQKYISELHIYEPFPKTHGSNFCRFLKTYLWELILLKSEGCSLQFH